MSSDHESLLQPSPEELYDDDDAEDGPSFDLREARDLPTEVIEKILSGEESSPLLDRDDLREVLLRRSQKTRAFFGWKLYKSLKEKEIKREEKKKLKQKKKK